jgi:hypothetical protein
MTDTTALDLLKKELDEAALKLEELRVEKSRLSKIANDARDAYDRAYPGVEAQERRVGRYVAAIAALEGK